MGSQQLTVTDAAAELVRTLYVRGGFQLDGTKLLYGDPPPVHVGAVALTQSQAAWLRSVLGV